MEHRLSVDPERLLAHTGWMHALASSLLRDAIAADDVVQDAAVAALLHAPAGERELAPWLSRVVKNFARRRQRGERRRRDREAEAGSPEPEPGPADTLERLELQQTVLEAVRAIDEPLRTALVLRYFEGKSSAEIARMLRVPAGTVRWRLSRGLAELRAKLDARFGSRATWALLFAPFARPVPPPPVVGVAASSSKILTGVLAMNAAQVGLTAAVLLVVGGIAWWSFGDRTGASESVAGAATTKVAPDSETLTPAPTQGLARESVSGTDAVSTNTAASETPATTPATAESRTEPLVGVVDARFVDEHGAPWSGVRFAAHAVAWVPNWRPDEGVASGSDGRATLRVILPTVRRNTTPLREFQLVLVASRAGCGTIERATTLRADATVHLGDVVLGPGVSLRGRVVDERGDGVQATIGVAAVELPADEGHTRRFGCDAFRDAPGAQSTADGTFVLEGVAPGARRVWAHAEGKRYAWTAAIDVPSDRDVLGIDILLTPLLATDRIAGRVLAPDDHPVANAHLWFDEHSPGNRRGSTTAVDAEGRFDLLVQHDDSSYAFTARDPEKRFAATTLDDVHPGSLDVVIRMHAQRWLPIHVHAADGAPVEGASFSCTVHGLSGEDSATNPSAGEYALAVPDGKFGLEITARGFHTRDLGVLESATLPATLDVVLRRAPVVRGRVTANGAAIAGARVHLAADIAAASDTVSGYRYRYWVPRGDTGATTDADGRFSIDCDVDGGFWLRATADGWAPGEVGPIDAAQREGEIELDVELTKGGAIEGRVILRDGADGEGTIVALNHGDACPQTLRAGAKGVFRVDGLAPGSWQVSAAESEIDPARAMYRSIANAPPIEWSCSVSAGATTHFDLDLTRK